MKLKVLNGVKRTYLKNSSLALNGFAMAGLELLNFKYLQKMNKEQNVEGLNVSPAIAKPDVTCCASSYP